MSGSHNHFPEPQRFAAGLPTPLRINFTLLALIGSLATTVGLAPWVAFFQRPLWLVWIAVAALGISALALRNLSTRATEAPHPLEFLLGFAGAVASPAAAALSGIIVYGATWGIWWLTRWTAPFLGFDIGIEPAAIAFWPSAIMTAIVGFANLSQSIGKLAKQLYPRTTGVRSAFYSMVRFRRGKTLLRLGLTLAYIVGGPILAFSVPRLGGWYCLLLAWTLVVVATQFQSHEESEKITAATGDSVQGVKELFEAGGYAVVASPRTGRSDIDPLLVNSPDLYAEGPERAYAIQVRTPELKISKDDDWTALSNLSSAAWALQNYVNENRKTSPISVSPLAVLVAVQAPVAVRIYEKKGLLQVLEIEEAKILSDLTRIDDENERAAVAAQHLRLGEAGPLAV